MQLTIQNPTKTLNKAFLKRNITRAEITLFKNNLKKLFENQNEKESEEYHKNLLGDFFKNTYYSPHHFINTKGRNDFVIHNDKTPQSPVGVIIEAKKTSNKAEMPTTKKINTKALHELVLYYLRERITHKNLEIKHLIITNLAEWFVFDVLWFERVFAQNKSFVKQFEDFENKLLADYKTEFFYKQIVAPFVDSLTDEVVFTHFDLNEFLPIIQQNEDEQDILLIPLYKIFSPQHLLKKPFANDSNTLDKGFYLELLHIIGLTETKDGSKKLIQRLPKDQRCEGSLLENAITQLDAFDKINQLPHKNTFGNTTDEQLFGVALELCITWINRILFLKLLENQLFAYNENDETYLFLRENKIKNYHDLDKLFFQVLAKLPENRSKEIQNIFSQVPYLNSSLFEVTSLEQTTISINALDSHVQMPLYSGTILKDFHGKMQKGNINALYYLLDFLNAYNFGNENPSQIQEENKSLINASVLGLIFEKINGYKDGSFFTPGFITMYMCKETIRKAVIQKFNEVKKWNCNDIDELYEKIEDKKEANHIINSIKICDPAVGSGHFLVSALNELIALKSDLKLFYDSQGKRLKECTIEVLNDELVIYHDEDIFQYNPKNKESQEIQQMIFHEKQTIIENCLFGVDINPNSVKICRLRLWIELLKNAYYRPKTKDLETLPNIDINIKCGNSLISRFDINTDMKDALKKSKWDINMYKSAVHNYKNATDKQQKRETVQLIESIKNDFRTEISKNNPLKKKLFIAQGKLLTLTTQTSVFGQTPKEKKEWDKQTNKLTEEIQKLETEIQDIQDNKIYENAFEWRFEFPEVLNQDGDFVGFDVIIGNPPYISFQSDILTQNHKNYFGQHFSTSFKVYDTFGLFSELAITLLKPKFGNLSYICPSVFLTNESFSKLREFLFKNGQISNIVNCEDGVFSEAIVPTIIYQFIKNSESLKNIIISKPFGEIINGISEIEMGYAKKNANEIININITQKSIKILEKIEKNGIYLSNILNIKEAIKTGNNKDLISNEYSNKFPNKIITGKEVSKYSIKDFKYFDYNPKNLSRGHSLELFEGEKLFIRRVGNDLICAYSSDLIFATHVLYIGKILS